MDTNQARLLRRLAVLAFVSVLLVVFWQYLPVIGTSDGAEKAAPREVTPRGDLAADEKSTIAIFEKSKGSVVFISTSEQVMDFWTRNAFSVPKGSGSGFIWDDAGHVITNFHVIEGAAEARVKLADGRDYKATLVGASQAHDIAVLKIGVAAKRPPPVPLGESHNLKVGQKVFAIGNPFGLDWTLTTGIISALDRSLGAEDGNTIEHLIQTDAAINPGNSGGPLLDSAGRLIGINTAIYSPSGASAGIGFAVPADTVNRVVPQLIRQGKYIRPTLGIGVDEQINQRLKDVFNLNGVFVLVAAKGSGADAKGFRGARLLRDGSVVPGDVIVAVEGKSVESVGQLLARLDDYKVGDTVRISVLRGKSKTEISAVLQPGI
jgi:S1-C subfamily serine protease